MQNPASVCDSCGRPPRLCEATKALIPLKKCSRCCLSFYHDAECQRKHFKDHKKACQIIAKENSLVKQYNDERGAMTKDIVDLLAIQTRTDGEMGLFASQNIDVTLSQPVQFRFHAIAPPILFKEFRRTHCAFCFQKVCDPEEAVLGSDDPRYPVLLCSDECSAACRDWMQDEIWSIRKALEFDANMMVLPMAIQVYRLLRFADWKEVMSMQSHVIVEDTAILDTVHRLGYGTKQMVDTFLEENPENGAELLQRQCVLMTISRMLSVNKYALKSWMHRNGNKYTVNEDLISDFLQRIKYNAFTLTADDTAPGFAMFERPSYRMNHSCESNARQTYVLQKGQFPQLLVDIKESIPAGKEVCISYVDCEDVSVVDRRMELAKKYRFHCHCPRCMVDAL